MKGTKSVVSKKPPQFTLLPLSVFRLLAASLSDQHQALMGSLLQGYLIRGPQSPFFFSISLNNSCNFLFGSWTQRSTTCSNSTPGLAEQEWVLSQNLHCSSVIEGTHMRLEESHPFRKESLVVVPQISRQATLRCPWT